MRSTRALVLVGVVIGLLSGVVVGATLSGVPASGDVTFQTNSGLTVNKTNVNEVPAQPFADDQTVQFDSGTVAGDSKGQVTIGSLNGSTTELTNIQAGATTITVDPAAKREFSVSGDLENITVQKDYAVDDGSADFTYGGTGTSAEVTLNGLPASTTIAAYEPATNEILEVSQSDASGAVTFDTLPLSTHTVSLNTGTNAPEQTNPNPDGTVSNDPVTLSVDVDDDDFPSDNVTATFFLDGNQVGTKTLQSPGTASVQVNGISGGAHTWSVNTTDAYGNSNVRQYSINLPANATVYEVADPPEKLDNRQINGSFIRPDEDVVISRETTTGNFSLRGLPVDSPYIVSLEADNVVDRRTVVFSLIEQQRFYLLNQSANTVDVEFQVDDRTGEFGDDSLLVVERALNTTDTAANETKYVNVAGDQIGSRAAFTTTLEGDIRYRVRIVSPDGQSRQLGAFSVNRSRSVDLVITGLNQGVADTDSTGPTINTTRDVSGSGGSKTKTVRFMYQDPDNETSALSLTIHEAGNPSNVFAQTDAAVTTLPLGNFSYKQTFSGAAANTTLVANYSYTRGGERVDRTMSFGAAQNPIGIPLGDGWAQIFGVGFLVVLGGIFSIGNARIGALVIPGVAFVLNVTGILSGVVTLASVGLAFAVAVGYNLVTASAAGGLATR